MRHLYIIGNGFDLAHGLKTSYHDFFIWYIRKQFLNIYESQSTGVDFDDSLLKVKRKAWNPSISFPDIKKEVESIDCSKTFKEKIEELGKLSSMPFKIDYSTLLSFICDKDGWADIEKIYYDLLVHSLSDRNSLAINDLNISFNALKNQFKCYLNDVVVPQINALTLNDKIYKIEYLISLEYIKEPFEDLMFINFNYTNLLDFYNVFRKKGVQQIDIHGQLNNPENPIIFGYGDELHSMYKDIESTGNNEYLKNMKSIGYLKKENYKKILGFINTGEYYVHIMGHSLGLSDRLLLNTILENDNCKHIEIHYYKTSSNKDNSEELGINLYRHFNDKAKLREKVISFEKTEPMNTH